MSSFDGSLLGLSQIRSLVVEVWFLSCFATEKWFMDAGGPVHFSSGSLALLNFFLNYEIGPCTPEALCKDFTFKDLACPKF